MSKIVTTIESRSKLEFIDIKELKDYRDLFYYMVLREIKVLYKQTILGFSWAIIRPVFSMVVFTIVFGSLAKVPSDGIPYSLFSYTALVPWTYFSMAMTKSTQSLVLNQAIFSKVYYPRLIIPLTPVIAGIIDFLIALVIVFFLMAWFSIVPTWKILHLPFLIILMVLSASGIGMLFSALAVQYRDIRHAIQFFTQMLMYAAPVVWPVSLITEKFGDTARLFYGLYPMAGVIEGFRSALLNHNPMPWDLIFMGTISSVFIFFIGAFYFKYKEYIFADVA